MDQKTKTMILVIIIIALTLGVFAFIKSSQKPTQADQKNASKVIPTSQSTTKNQPQELVKPAGDTTIEGMIISIGEKEIAIENNTSTPALFAISSKTPIVIISKDGKETASGLSELRAGSVAKVFFDEKDSAKNKEAKKIVIAEK